MTKQAQAPMLRRPVFPAGYVLIWKIGTSVFTAAAEEAASMGKLSDAHTLGTWGVAEVGLGGSGAYFDLVLDVDVELFDIKFIFGRLPDSVY